MRVRAILQQNMRLLNNILTHLSTQVLPVKPIHFSKKRFSYVFNVHYVDLSTVHTVGMVKRRHKAGNARFNNDVHKNTNVNLFS